MRSLITGSEGFIGHWLAEALREHGDEVIGTSFRTATKKTTDSTVYTLDITDASAVEKLIQTVKPDRIFHLAAQSNIPKSFSDPQATMHANVNGTLNIMKAMRQHTPQSVLLSIGSSAEYGRCIQQGIPVSEESLLAPMSPYGISKATQGMYVGLYTRAYEMKIIHVRPFAIIGPGKRGDAVSHFCTGIIDIEEGRADHLPVGNMNAIRDFVDVRDCVSAFLLAIENGTPGEVYNISTGKATSMEDVFRELQAAARSRIQIKIDPAYFRHIDDPWIVGNSTKITQLGFKPAYSLETTAKDTLEYWRTQHHA